MGLVMEPVCAAARQARKKPNPPPEPSPNILNCYHERTLQEACIQARYRQDSRTHPIYESQRDRNLWRVGFETKKWGECAQGAKKSQKSQNFCCNEDEKNAKIISGWFPKLVVGIDKF